MLTIGKLAPGMVEYYERQVALGVEEYYTGAKEAPGQWLGRGAELLALSGEVDAEHLHRVLEHVDPHGGFNLTGGRSAPKVAGFDATFSAPKSVSLLYALGDGETSNVVRNAHDNALRAAFGFYQQQASLVRRGHAGMVVQSGDGLVAAEFRHRTSRAGDPQLHTHVVIANVARNPLDGRWSALHAHPGVYAWARPVGHLYQAQLRYDLSCTLGVDWTPVRNGTAEVRGFAREQLRAFSHRRVEIEAHLEAHGETSAKAAQLAAYATRQPKDPDATPGNLFDTWRAQAHEVGLDANALAATLHVAPLQLAGAVDSVVAQRLYDHLAGPDGLTRERSTFGRGEVICAICDALPHGAPVAKVLALTDTFLQHHEVLSLPAPDGAAPVRWTTIDMLTTERALLDGAAARTGAHVAIAEPQQVAAALAQRPILTAEQWTMVQRLCKSGAGVDVVDGVAGAGKTTALAAAAEAWTASGYQVHGVALAARTAQRLEAATGIESMSVARYLHQHHTGTATLGRGEVLVVDEAGMIGTRILLELAELACAADAKLVLVGDPRQLPELTAGGAFAGLADRLPATVLTNNTRQHEDWERDALAKLRTGATDRALAAYEDHGRVHVADDIGTARHQVVADWYSARRSGADVLMVAVSNRDVDALNQHARRRLQADGTVGPDRIAVSDRAFAVGDEVMCLRNDRRVGVLNGTRGTIVAIDTTVRTVTIHTDTKQTRDLPFGYLGDGGLTHGYASTLHKAQGATVDRAFVLAGDGLPREYAYTAMSRGREANHLYIAPIDRRVEERHATELSTTARDRLEQAIARSVGHQLASTAFTPTDQRLLELADEERAIRDRIGHGPPDRLRELHDAEAKLRESERALADAQRRHDRARQDLQRLGPIGRTLHARDASTARSRITSATHDINRCSDIVEHDRARVEDLEHAVGARDEWRNAHRPDLDRLGAISAQRAVAHLDLERAVQRCLDPRIAPTLHHKHGTDHGIDLGL